MACWKVARPCSSSCSSVGACRVGGGGGGGGGVGVGWVAGEGGWGAAASRRVSLPGPHLTVRRGGLTWLGALAVHLANEGHVAGVQGCTWGTHPTKARIMWRWWWWYAAQPMWALPWSFPAHFPLGLLSPWPLLPPAAPWAAAHPSDWPAAPVSSCSRRRNCWRPASLLCTRMTSTWSPRCTETLEVTACRRSAGRGVRAARQSGRGCAQNLRGGVAAQSAAQRSGFPATQRAQRSRVQHSAAGRASCLSFSTDLQVCSSRVPLLWSCHRARQRAWQARLQAHGRVSAPSRPRQIQQPSSVLSKSNDAGIAAQEAALLRLVPDLGAKRQKRP
jgi:hypothetical protein